jgi:transcriptional regulator with XRE-family HTH domain
MIISNQIKRLRKSKKITQKAFALSIGMTPIHYCKIENNRQAPSINILERIAKATDTQLVITFIDKE